MSKHLSRIIVLLLPLILLCHIAQSQSDVDFVKAARKSWDNLNYYLAKDQYKSAIEQNKANFDANLELGILQMRVYQDFGQALQYFNDALSSMPRDTVYELFQFLGETNQSLENYPDAISNYRHFLIGIVKNDSLKSDINRRIKQCEFAMTYNEILWEGKFVNFGEVINSESSEYCAVLPMKDSFLLFTKRMSESIDGKVAYIAWEEIYFSKSKNRQYREADNSKQLSDFENLSAKDKGHYSVVSTTVSGDTMVIYRQNNLWYSVYNGSQWGIPVKFSKEINFGRNQRHGCFSPDGKEFIFSSRTKGGGLDLFSSKLKEDGLWSEAVALGAEINSYLDEDSPFMSKDGKRLYFSSKGHLGFGGYDVFYCDRIDTTWSKPKNAGRPFNSPEDDIYFAIANDDVGTAMLSSSRSNGFGQMDLYYFYQYGLPKFENCISKDNSQVVDSTVFNESVEHVFVSGRDTMLINESSYYQGLKSSIPNAEIRNIFFRVNDSIMELDSIELSYDSIGSYRIEMEVLARDEKNEEYRFCAVKDINVVLPPEIKEPIRKVKDTNELALSFGSKISDEDMSAVPEELKVDLESIFFDFNKSSIRTDQKDEINRNIEIIKANPNIVIKVIGHTDKVGTAEYNLKLSTKRAKSAVDYLISKGVNPKQIVAVLAQGEDSAGDRYKLEDGTDDIEKMQESRRVDFYVIGVLK
ncbi:MAG: OmpA family protein [Flavobacteriales bacterium]|nr:OmpA family protein [Flavobacteriales bacterium]